MMNTIGTFLNTACLHSGVYQINLVYQQVYVHIYTNGSHYMYSLQAVISACKNTYNVHTDLILSDGCQELLPAM